MKKYTATKARDCMSEILRSVSDGEDVLIEKFGKPVAIVTSPDKHNASVVPSNVSVAILPWKDGEGDDAGISVHRSLYDVVRFVQHHSTSEENPVSAELAYLCSIPEGVFDFTVSDFLRIPESDLHLYGFGRVETV